MFANLIRYPIESDLLHWEAKVVVRDNDSKPSLYLRLKLTGTAFPIMDSLPFVRIGGVRARFVEIADDRASVKAYFETAPPGRGRVEFGYDERALLRFPRAYARASVERLDEARLPAALRYQGRLLGGARRPD